MSKHICIVTSAHPLDDVRVNSKVAQSFLAQGYRVSWAGPEITHHATSQDRDPNISYHLARQPQGRIDRLTSIRRVARKAREVADVDWYYSPDPDAAELAVRLAKKSRARALFDIHEIYHGALLDRWVANRRAPLVRAAVRKRISRTAARADLVMGVSDSVLRPYVRPSHPQVVVRNCAPPWFAERASASATSAAATPDGNGTMLFMHGKAHSWNGTPVILEALTHLGSARERGRVLMFSGRAADAAQYMSDLNRRIDALGVRDAVWLHETVPHEDVPSVTASCQVGMVAYGRGLGADSLPNRLFEYMAGGLAILAPDYATEIVRIVEQEKIGLTVDFENAAAVAEAMSWFISNPDRTRDMGARAREAFLERHNWDAEFRRLIAAMEAV
ncbi:glycosyltransferase [Isoptericola sp. b490]|uniref:glycosyltransferase n=1 Tax=Actinotalea lenta TaxID=3064654 RepID=UPI0027143FF6|nr:glycosyltransferase [Isoptericola sp. b490]MDO8119919.1 glycosyltransferase [Isoptericola sp. b490]